jgi:hypothetical protein
MKRILTSLLMLACALCAGADTVFFETGETTQTTTGDSLDGIGTNWTAVSVVEISGLTVSMATLLDGQTLNANKGDFGVKSGLTGEVDDRFDYGETVLMSFNKDIQITQIDFSDFDSGETFNFIIGSVTNSIAWADLDNQSSDYIENLTWNVFAGDIIRLEVAGVGDSLSMDSIDITVVPEPATMALIGIGGLLALIERRIRLLRRG